MENQKCKECVYEEGNKMNTTDEQTANQTATTKTTKETKEQNNIEILKPLPINKVGLRPAHQPIE